MIRRQFFSKDLIQKTNSKTVVKSNGCLGNQPNLIELNSKINLAASFNEFHLIWHLEFLIHEVIPGNFNGSI